MSLSVVMISANFHPYIGGAEKQALEVSKALNSRGVQVLVLTRRLKGLASYEEVEGIPVRRLAAWGSGILSSVSFIFSSLCYLFWNIRSYQAVHVHLASSPAIVAALVGKLSGKKVAVKLGGGRGSDEISLSRASFLGKLKLQALKLLRPILIVVSRDQIRELKGTGLENLEIRLIPNGVDTETYHPPSTEEKEKIRAKLGWKGLVFLYVGRLSPDKLGPGMESLKTFLEGWVAAGQGGLSGSFYLVGQGPQEEALRQLIRLMGLESTVHILRVRSEVLPLYQAADVFVLPSTTEGLSNALLEAMASGLPVLASRVSGTMEIVQEGIHGFLFNPLQPGDVSRRLTEMVRNPAQLREMGHHGRDLAVSKFSLEHTVSALMQSYLVKK